jgi:hypothetical protein
MHDAVIKSIQRKTRPALLAVVLALGMAASSQAQTIVTYGSLSGFNTALGAAPMTVEDFTVTSHFPIPSGVLNSLTNLPGIGIFPGTIQPGVTYSTPVTSGFFFNIDSGGGFTGGFLDTAVASTGPLTITFDTPAGAFGFDTSNLIVAPFTITINFTSGSPYNNSFSVPSSTPTFFGFQSTGANITSVVIGGGSGPHSFAIDNFRFTSVPEPSTFWLIGGGLAALLGWRRRRPA